ncbi:MAG: 5'-methylthioadenosine/adenosylhomocysteine nucleosidase [Firmicutes bacterium]|nr:5'-methylthioadenosine/adenosylhomocysteine nucleosidase [Bacillota bacterium]
MIGIIGAMDKEIELLLNEMDIYKEDHLADKIFYTGILSAKEVVIAKSGIGKVNATMTATLMLEKYQVTTIINIGIAGGLSPTQVGDIVIADGISYFDVDLTAIDNLPFGQMADDPLIVETDSYLRQKAIYVFEDYNISVLQGKLVSGDQFVTNIEILKPILKEIKNVLACEMEGMSIGLVCHKFNIPFLSIRGISDVIDVVGQKETYMDFSEKIAHTTSEFVLKFLEALE